MKWSLASCHTHVPRCYLDLETTGLFPERGDRVCEIAVIEGQKRWETLVYSGRSSTQRALELHELTEATLSGAPRFEELAGALCARLERRLVLGHQVIFDLRFLAAEFERCQLRAPRLWTLDTMTLARRIGLRAGSLDELADSLGLEPLDQPPHQAGRDAHQAQRCGELMLGRLDPMPLRELNILRVELGQIG